MRDHDEDSVEERRRPSAADAARATGDRDVPPAERVLALQRAAGNQAVGRLLAARTPGRRLTRWDVPLRSGVPPGAGKAVDFAVFIKLIQDEENKLSRDEYLNTKLMITKLRKLFYGSAGWDAHLIPGAAAVDPLYEFEEVETGRREYEAPGPNVLEFVDKRPRLKGAPAALANPGDVQEVRMPNGDFVDVGHVLAGLDAMNHPDSVAPYWMYRIDSNVDAVTWLGDLGSVLAEVIYQVAKKGGPLTDAELQAQVDEYAPAQDMLGNIDAYAIGSAFDIRDEGPSGARVCTPGKRVSEILLEYYGGAGTGSAKGAAARAKRFTTFTTKIGLGPLSGGRFANESTWLAKYEVQVGKAGALYVGASTEMTALGLTYSVGAKLGLMDAVRDHPFRRRLLEKFLDQLRSQVAAEAAAAPAPVP